MSNTMIGYFPSDTLGDVALGVIRRWTKGEDSLHLCGATDITECLDYSLSEIDSWNANFFGSVIKITIKTAFSAGPQQKQNARS